MMAEWRSIYPELSKKDLLLRLAHRDYETSFWYQLYLDRKRKRIEATKRLCPHSVFLADLHSHSPYSDGSAFNFDEICQWMKLAGLQLLAVTDHETFAHDKHCQAYPQLVCGGEFQCDGFDVVLLGVSQQEISETMSLSRKAEHLERLGGFMIIAHPCGSVKSTGHGTINRLKRISTQSTFGIEIVNAGGKLFQAWWENDIKAIKAWDELLRNGNTVFAFGNTDSHSPRQLGTVFNGIVGRRPARAKLVKKLRQGQHFVSDAPFIFLRVEDSVMGSKIDTQKPSLLFKIEAYDSGYLKKIRLVENGVVVRTADTSGKSAALLSFNERISTGLNYFRAEVYSSDMRRAYTNPIWVDRR